MPAPDAQKLWYSAEEGRQDAYRLVDELRSEGRIVRAYPRVSGAPAIKGRNPDYMGRDLMKAEILSRLDGRAMTEGELMEEMGRTRSIRSIILEMWKDEQIDGTYSDGIWKWTASAEGD
jgi:hypothetical protein